MRYIQRLMLIVCVSGLIVSSAAAQTVAQGAPGTLAWKINLFSGSTIVPLPTALGTDGGWKINWADAGVLTVSGPLTDAQLRATPVPISGTVTATTGGLTDTQLRASAVPVSFTQPALVAGSAVIGHVITDAPSTTAVSGNVAVTSAGLTNLDVALSTRTKPADQQHAILDSGTTTVTQGTGTNLHAVTDTGSTTAVTGNVAITAAALPLPSGAATSALQGSTVVTGNVAVTSAGLTNLDIALSALRDALVGVSARTLTDAYTQLATIITNQQNEQAIPGTTTIPARLVLVGGQTVDSPPQIQPLPLTYNGGALRTVTSPAERTLPLPLCNPVRRTNCQPKGF